MGLGFWLRFVAKVPLLSQRAGSSRSQCRAFRMQGVQVQGVLYYKCGLIRT